MLSSDFFDLKFVDRKNEMQKFKNALNKTNAIWIHGESGVGKTKFTKEGLKDQKKTIIIYANKPREEMTQSYLEILTKEISKERKQKEALIEKFKAVATTFASLAIKVDSDSIDNLISAFLKSNHSIGKVIFDALNMIHNKIRKPITIVLDNFSNCDNDSFQKMKDFFALSYDKKWLKLIFITTEEYLNNTMRFYLEDNIPHIIIRLDKFIDKEFFDEILKDKFSRFSEFESLGDYFSLIFDYCKGSLFELRSLLSKLYRNNSVVLENDSFDLEKIKSTLLKKLGIDFSDLSTSENNVLKILTIYSSRISVSKLKNLYTKIYGPSEFHRDLLENLVFKLSDSDILDVDQESQLIGFRHDKIFELLYEYYKKHQMDLPRIHSEIYNFIIHEEYHTKKDHILLAKLRAHHSYSAMIPEIWEYENKEYAQILFVNKRFYEARDVYSNLINHSKSISTNILINYSTVLFEINKFKESYEILEKVTGSKISKAIFSEYYILKVKLFSCLLYTEECIMLVDRL